MLRMGAKVKPARASNLLRAVGTCVMRCCVPPTAHAHSTRRSSLRSHWRSADLRTSASSQLPKLRKQLYSQGVRGSKRRWAVSHTCRCTYTRCELSCRCCSHRSTHRGQVCRRAGCVRRTVRAKLSTAHSNNRASRAAANRQAEARRQAVAEPAPQQSGLGLEAEVVRFFTAGPITAQSCSQYLRRILWKKVRNNTNHYKTGGGNGGNGVRGSSSSGGSGSSSSYGGGKANCGSRVGGAQACNFKTDGISRRKGAHCGGGLCRRRRFETSRRTRVGNVRHFLFLFLLLFQP
ncbi:hypothetical protein T492DRAFT_445099 [Pavlovales sp. CCMP2436]|nr:hypothetical protein T492DRAFT_445099 [Pavlovales sp. CCMP2436]